MVSDTAATTSAERRQKFSTLWDELALDKTTQFSADRTQTMRPTTDLQGLDPAAILGELPWLTQSHTQVQFAEIRLGTLLGEGGMGKINLAQQRSVAREVAVKSLHPKMLSPEAILTLLREGWVTGRLEHPNIVPIYTLGRGDEGQPIIVMKKIAGVSLAALLSDPSASPRALGTKQPLDFYIEILAQVCNAVHYAHSRGILHRDIKPENIMVGEFGEVYLLDWGIAVSLNDTHRGRLPLASQVTSPAGTPAYMAPEMIHGEGAQLSKKTDIFLLGAVLHEILTGEPPNQGETLFQIMFDAYNATPAAYAPGVDAQLAKICHRAMHAEPGERFESADALRTALETHLSHRDSLRIAEQAHARLARLREMIAQEIAAETTSAGALDAAQREQASQREQTGHAIYRLFGACRFGFEQALETSPENATAKGGLQQVIELLVERELQQGAHRAAALLIADLPEPNPILELRLAELGRQAASREREFEGLKREQFEQDLAVGRRSRSVYVGIMGALFGVLAVVSRLLSDWLEVAITPKALLLHALVVVIAALIPTWLARRALMRNSINRNLIYMVLLTLFYTAVMRGAGWLFSLPVAAILVMEMASYAAISISAAIFTDRQILWMSAAIALGALVAALYPAHAIESLGASLFVGFLALALAWHRVDRR